MAQKRFFFPFSTTHDYGCTFFTFRFCQRNLKLYNNKKKVFHLSPENIIKGNFYTRYFSNFLFIYLNYKNWSLKNPLIIK